MASRGVNKVILIGSLGGDPEIRYLPNGNAVANVSLATSDTWKDKQTGQQQERTEWHRVVFFGRIAEVVNEYARKGSKLYVEGKLQTREWEKDGQKRYITEVIVDMGGQMQLLDGNRQQSNQQNGNNAPQGQQGNQNGGQQRQQSRPQGQQQQQQQSRPQGQQQSGYGQQRQAPNQGNQGNNGNFHQDSHDYGGGDPYDDDIPFAALPSTYII